MAKTTKNSKRVLFITAKRDWWNTSVTSVAFGKTMEEAQTDTGPVEGHYFDSRSLRRMIGGSRGTFRLTITKVG